MDENIYINQNNNLNRLKNILNFGISSSILYFLSFQVFIFIFLASAAALIFTPFMLFVLFKEKKKGWIVLFILLVIIPIIILIISSIIYAFSKPLLFVPLGLFYFYCFLLRFEVNDWAREMSAKNQRLLKKKKREEELKSFVEKFD